MRSFPSCWNKTLAQLGFKRKLRKDKKVRHRFQRRSLFENLEQRQMLDATTYEVTTLLDVDQAGTNSDQLWSLREALIHSANDAGPEIDTIQFADGLRGSLNLELGELSVHSNVDIQGPGADALKIDAKQGSRVFNVGNITAAISGLTITGGQVLGSADGGGIYNDGDLSLQQVAIVGNFSEEHGGGIYNDGDLTLEQVSITGNSSEGKGGGVYTNENGAKLTLIDSTVDDNDAASGGGIYGRFSLGESLVITGSTISNNRSTGAGGGLFYKNRLTGENTAASAKIFNSTFSGNKAGTHTGGIRLKGDGADFNNTQITIINSTVTGNISNSTNPDNGGGLNRYSFADVTLHNSIVSGNYHRDVESDISGSLNNASSYNRITSGAGGLTNDNGNVVDVPFADLKLAPLGDYGGPTKTHALLPGSEAIDGGLSSHATGITIDQRGAERRVDQNPTGPGLIDVGAFELSAQVATDASADFNGDGREDQLRLDPVAGYLMVVEATDVGHRISPWGQLDTTGDWQQFHPGDFDGDGRDDVWAYDTTAAKWTLLISDGTVFVPATKHDVSQWSQTFVGDFDADGASELLGRTSSGSPWQVLHYDANVGATLDSDWGISLVAPTNLMFVRDVNADGRDDLVAKTSASWWVVLSNEDTLLDISQSDDWNDWLDGYLDPNDGSVLAGAEDPYQRVLDEFSWVYNNVELELYPGLMKGITATEQTQAGNPWDQAALLVDRLEDAIGVNRAEIASGRVRASVAKLVDWIGVDNSVAAFNLLITAIDNNSIPVDDNGNDVRDIDVPGQPEYTDGDKILLFATAIEFQHAWVRAKVPTATGFEWVDLDPSWKFRERHDGIPVDLDPDGTGHGTYDEFAYIASSSWKLPLEYYEDQVMSHLIQNHEGSSLADVPTQGSIIAEYFDTIPTELDSSVVIVDANGNGTDDDVSIYNNFNDIVDHHAEELTHRVTIALDREINASKRSSSLTLQTGFDFGSDDVPGSFYLDPSASAVLPYNYDPFNDPDDFLSNESLVQPGVDSRFETPFNPNGDILKYAEGVHAAHEGHVAIAMQNSGYTVTPSTRIEADVVGVESTQGDSDRHLFFGFDTDLVWNFVSPAHKVDVTPNLSSPQKITSGSLPPALHDTIATYAIFGSYLMFVEHAKFGNFRIYEERGNFGNSTSVLSDGSIYQSRSDYASADLGSLDISVDSNTVLELEFKTGANESFLHAVGWDSDDSSLNNDQQASSLYKLAGTSTSSDYSTISPIETTTDGYSRYEIPIGSGLSASEMVSLKRLLFHTDVNDGESVFNSKSYFRNIKFKQADIGSNGPRWSHDLIVPEVSLDSIVIDYPLDAGDASSSNVANTYTSRLLINDVVATQSSGIFQQGDNAKLRISHFAPTALVSAPTEPQDTRATIYDRDVDLTSSAPQLMSIALDANQHSRESLATLQLEAINDAEALIPKLESETDTLADRAEGIDGLLAYAGAKYWHDFNESNDSIAGLTRTVHSQTYVGSGIAFAEPEVIPFSIPNTSDTTPVSDHLNYGFAPQGMGVDLPNASLSIRDQLTGSTNVEVRQLGIANASALEHSVIEEAIFVDGISTIKGLQNAYRKNKGVDRDHGSVSDDSILIFERVQSDNKVYFRGEWNTTNSTVPTGIVREITDEVGFAAEIPEHQPIGGGNNIIAESIWNILNTSAEDVRVMIPKYKSNTGNWTGSVYLVESDSRITYAIAREGGPVTSGGGSSDQPLNLSNAFQAGSFKHHTSAGDPVNTANGSMFRDDVDFVYRNIGVPLDFARHYNSQNNDDVGLGVGWTHSFSDVLYQQDPMGDPNDLVWLTSSGQRHEINNVHFASGVAVPASLSRDGVFLNETASNTYIYKNSDGMEYHFEKIDPAVEGDPAIEENGRTIRGRLLKIIDRFGSGVQVTYQPTGLRKVNTVEDVHDANRKLSFGYGANDRINSVTKIVPGEPDRVWNYGYRDPIAGTDGLSDERLKEVTAPTVDVVDDAGTIDSLRPKISYESYSSGTAKGRISKIIEPNNYFHEYTYYPNGRVFQVKDGMGHTQHFNYNLTRNLTEFTDELGNVETYIHLEDGLLSRQIHPDRTRQDYTWNSSDLQMDSQTDEQGYQELFQTTQGKITQYTAKDGVTSRYRYDSPSHSHYSHLRNLDESVVDASSSGNGDNKRITTDYHYSNQKLLLVDDANGNRTKFDYSTIGLLEGTEIQLNTNVTNWREVATGITLSGNTLTIQATIEIATPNSNITNIDAVRIDRLDLNGQVIYSEIIDDTMVEGDAKFSIDVPGPLTFIDHHTDFFPGFNSDTYGSSHINSSDDTGSGSVTWAFSGVSPGLYRILIPNFFNSSFDDSVTYRIYDGTPIEANEIASAVVDQTSFDITSRDTSHSYDTAGNRTQTTMPDGLKNGFSTFDSWGNLTQHADGEGVITSSTHDALGRQKRSGVADPDGAGPLTALDSTFEYDLAGRLRFSTDPLGRTTEFQYDLKGNITKRIEADGTFTTFEYDALNNRVSQSDALGRTTRFVYDARNRLVETIHPDGAREKVRYDARGQVVATIDPLGRETTFKYDPVGRVTETRQVVTSGQAFVTTNKYDSVGNLVETIDPVGNTTQFEYDNLGQVIEIRTLDGEEPELSDIESARNDPDPVSTSLYPVSLTTTDYDGSGNAIRIATFDTVKLEADGIPIPADPKTLITNANVASDHIRVVFSEYDHLGRITQTTAADSTTTSVGYDAAGRVDYTYDELGRKTEHIYDDYGRLLTTTYPDPGDGQAFVFDRFTYDAAGNQISITQGGSFDGANTSFDYDVFNRVVTTTDAEEGQSRNLYDVAGQLVATVDALGRAAYTRYDERGRTKLTRLPVAELTDSSGYQPPATTHFTYDAVGNLIEQIDPRGFVSKYDYDELNRLWRETSTISHLPQTGDIGVGDPKSGVPASDAATGSAFIMYTEVSTDQRFALITNQSKAEHFVVVRYDAQSASWQYNNDDNSSGPDSWTNFTPAVTDVLLAEVDLGNGVNQDNTIVADLEGTNDVYQGIRRGYADGDLAFFADQWNNSPNNGEFQVTGTFFTLSHVPQTGDIGVGDPKSGVPASDAATGSAFIMYTEVSTDQRFALITNQSKAEHFVVVRYDAQSASWQYNNDDNSSGPDSWTNFTPAVTDVLLAEVDLGNGVNQDNTIVADLEGTNDVYQGIRRGYADGDLAFFADQWNNSPNNGEFQVTGTFFTLADASTIAPVLVNSTAQRFYFYDNNGNLTYEFDTLGRLTFRSYDELNRIERVVEPDPDGPSNPLPSPETTTEYDGYGNVAEIVELRGGQNRRTVWTYDQRNRVLTETLDAGESEEVVTTFEYDAVGNLKQQIDDFHDTSTDAVNATTDLEYDGLNRLRKETVYAGTAALETQFTYDARGNVISSIEATRNDGHTHLTTALFTYDKLDRQTSVVRDPFGTLEATTTFAYDAVGNMLGTTDPLGNLSTNEYDRLDRLIKSAAPDPDGEGLLESSVATFEYDIVGDLIAQTNGENETERFVYDSLGRLVRSADGLGAQSHSRYDSEGNLISFTDPNDNTTTYAYDDLNRLTSETINLNGVPISRSYAYNDQGNLAFITDREGRLRIFGYDRLDRRTSEVGIGGPTTANQTWRYDNLGRVTRSEDVNGTFNHIDTFVYDELGRIVEHRNHDPDAPTLPSYPLVRQAWDYDVLEASDALELVKTDYAQYSVDGLLNETPMGATRYTTDRLGRTVSLVDITTGALAKFVDFDYDANDRLEKIERTANNGQLQFDTTYTYDDAGRVRSILHEDASTAPATTIVATSYAYDRADRITGQSAIRNTALPAFAGVGPFLNESFTFDNAGQLKSATGSASESFAYDANGNRTTGTVIGEHNRLLEDADYTYTYDNEGNLTRKTRKPTGSPFDPGYYVDYTYDHRNRLTSATEHDGLGQPQGQGLTYRYNADDQLVYRKREELSVGPFPDPVSEAHYVNDGVDRALEIDGETDELAHRYVNGPLVDQVLFDEVFDEFGQQDELLALAADHLGTTRAVLDETGAITQTIDYDSFGTITDLRDANGNQLITYPPGSVSGEFDTQRLVTDIAFAGRHWDDDAELYNNRARWYDPNTGRFISEDPIEEGSNWYRYAGNDPINFRDPTGLAPDANPLNSLFGTSQFGSTTSTFNPLQFGSSGFTNQILGTGTTSFNGPVNTSLGTLGTSTFTPSFSSPTLSSISVPSIAGPAATPAFTSSINTLSGLGRTNLANFISPDLPTVGGGRDAAGFQILSGHVSGLGRGAKDVVDAIGSSVFTTASNLRNDFTGTLHAGVQNIGSGLQSTKDALAQFTVGNFFAEGRADNLASINAGIAVTQNAANQFANASPFEQGRTVGQALTTIGFASTPLGKRTGGRFVDDFVAPRSATPPSTPRIHGNSPNSPTPNHAYVIVDTADGSLVKPGVSGSTIRQNGNSPRATYQVNKLNQGQPGRYKAVIVERDVSRTRALEIEQLITDKHAARNAGASPSPIHQRPRPQVQSRDEFFELYGFPDNRPQGGRY